MNHSLRYVAASACALLLNGCNRSPDTSPPHIRYGEQECDACHMLVNDERFAAALVFQQEGGVTKLVFDDINCVFAYLAEHPVGGSYIVYTHDVFTRSWLDSRTAFFVHSDKLETPMVSQIAAASTLSGADNVLKQYPGERLSFEEVARRFTRSAQQEGGQKAKTP